VRFAERPERGTIEGSGEWGDETFWQIRVAVESPSKPPFEPMKKREVRPEK